VGVSVWVGVELTVGVCVIVGVRVTVEVFVMVGVEVAGRVGVTGRLVAVGAGVGVAVGTVGRPVQPARLIKRAQNRMIFIISNINITDFTTPFGFEFLVEFGLFSAFGIGGHFF